MSLKPITRTEHFMGRAAGNPRAEKLTPITREEHFLEDIVEAIESGGGGGQPLITATGMLKGDGNGNVSAAIAGTDYDTASSVVSATAAMTPAQAAQMRQNIGAGEPLTPEQIAESAGAWLEDNMATPSTPPIDSSLSVANAVADAKAAGDKIGEVKSQLSEISGESYNMFVAENVTIGTNGSGKTGFPKRAISAAYDGGTDGLTISCKNLPSNLKYEVDGYTDENYGSIANLSGGWVTSAGRVTIATTKRYVRILFGSVNNANLTVADFDGLEMQIERGQGASAYAPHITAIDYVVRNNNKTITNVHACTYNIGLYSYGLSQNDPPADAMSKLIVFLSKYGFDMMGLQECRDTVNGANINNTVYNDFFFSQANGSTPPRPAIKTQYQLTSIGTGTFTAGSRPYIYGTAKIGGKDVFVMSVHFALIASDRALNYTELLSILTQHERFIVFGDFNAANESAPEDKAAQAQAEFNNLINAGYTVANGGRWGLLSTAHNVTNYWDNVCVSSNIKMISASVLDSYDEMTSDHLPIVVDVVV